MERIRTQAKDMFPTIYLTMISMIQALALEVLWSAVSEREYLRAWNSEAVIGWLQVAAMALLLFYIWNAFATTVIRYRWVFSTRDSAVPFVAGIAQFSLIGLIQPGTVHVWFYVFAATMVFFVWFIWRAVRSILSEPDNADVVEVEGRVHTPARPFALALVPVCLVAGGLAQWSGGSGWMTVLLTAITTALVFGLVVANASGTRRALEA